MPEYVTFFDKFGTAVYEWPERTENIIGDFWGREKVILPPGRYAVEFDAPRSLILLTDSANRTFVIQQSAYKTALVSLNAVLDSRAKKWLEHLKRVPIFSDEASALLQKLERERVKATLDVAT